MKRLFYLAAFSAFLLNACSSGSDATTNESDVLLRRTIETYDDGSTVTTNYTYNGKKLTGQTDSDGARDVITYTGDLITNIKSYDDTNTLYTEDFYTYNSSNQLTTYVIKNYDTGNGRRETFVYNSDGTISYSVYKGDNTAQTDLTETGTVIRTNGEVTRINKSYDDGFISYTASYIYTYDAKNNPFKNVIGFDKIDFINQEAVGFARNILTETYTSSLSNNSLYTTTYTYNSLNYPLTSQDVEDGTPSSTISTQYFYN